jgi:hypothetical protein
MRGDRGGALPLDSGRGGLSLAPRASRFCQTNSPAR